MIIEGLITTRGQTQQASALQHLPRRTQRERKRAQSKPFRTIFSSIELPLGSARTIINRGFLPLFGDSVHHILPTTSLTTSFFPSLLHILERLRESARALSRSIILQEIIRRRRHGPAATPSRSETQQAEPMRFPKPHIPFWTSLLSFVAACTVAGPLSPTTMTTAVRVCL